MKKLISIVLIFIILISCCACGDFDIIPKPGKEERSLVMRQNNLEIETVDYELNTDGWVNKQYFKISGLKDETIQNAINKEIEDAFFKACNWEDYPKYRGIKAELKNWEGISPYSENVSVSQRCNVGNVLSVLVDSQLNYEKPNNPDYGSDWLYIADYECLNYDLNTGKQLKITDVFADGIDGLDYINNLIYDKLNNTNSDEEEYFWSDGWDSFKIVGEFPGITEDQKFYISDYGDTLYIVLDDKTPWVMLNGYNPIYFAVDIAKVSALGNKFIKDNIYTDESINYTLLNNSYDGLTLSYIDQVEEYNYRGINNLSYSQNLSYYEGMPDYIIEAEKQFAKDCQPQIDEFIENYAMPNKDNEFFNGWITVTSNIMRYGNYTTVSINLYLDASQFTGEYESIYNGNENKTLLFKDGIEEPLKLEDLFVPGYDYKTELGIDDSYSIEIFTDMLFAIKSGEFLSFPYKEIGCENMTIFE